MGEHGGSDTGTWGCLSSFILFLIDRGKWILRKLLYYRYTIDALDFFLSFVAAGIDEVNCWKTGLSFYFSGHRRITRLLPGLCSARSGSFNDIPHPTTCGEFSHNRRNKNGTCWNVFCFRGHARFNIAK